MTHNQYVVTLHNIDDDIKEYGSLDGFKFR